MNLRRLLRALPALLFTCSMHAAIVSLTGTLDSADGAELYIFELSAPGTVTLQTYGFGGGTNSAGVKIAAGGFDPFVALFSGTGNSAVFLDGSSDNLSNYTSEPNACGPAGLVTIGNVANQCGDVRLQFTALSPGPYTVLLSDANYVPNAVYEAPGGTLRDGFSDLTGGSLPFQTCYDENNCNTDTANWALDVATGSGATSSAPEPATYLLTGFALLARCVISQARRKA